MSSSSSPQTRGIICCCLYALLTNGCFLIPSEDDIYREKLRESQGRARIFGHVWRIARAQKDDLDAFQLSKKTIRLVDYFDESGLDWEHTGSSITYEEIVQYVAGYVTHGHLDDLAPSDAWGYPYEFRFIEGFLAVRSPGADGVFNQSVYYGESFPWLSGGDIVVIGGRDLTQIEIPQASDWFRLTPPPGKESDGND